MKAKLQALKYAVGGGLAAAAVGANAAAPDFTTITSAVDFSTVITAIMAVAAIMVGVYVAWRGAKFALRAVKGL